MGLGQLMVWVGWGQRRGVGQLQVQELSQQQRLKLNAIISKKNSLCVHACLQLVESVKKEFMKWFRGAK